MYALGRFQRLTSQVVRTTVVIESGKPSARPAVSITIAEALVIMNAEITIEAAAPTAAAITAARGVSRHSVAFFTHTTSRIACPPRDARSEHRNAHRSRKTQPPGNEQVEERLGLAGEPDQEEAGDEPAAATENSAKKTSATRRQSRGRGAIDPVWRVGAGLQPRTRVRPLSGSDGTLAG